MVCEKGVLEGYVKIWEGTWRRSSCAGNSFDELYRARRAGATARALREKNTQNKPPTGMQCMLVATCKHCFVSVLLRFSARSYLHVFVTCWRSNRQKNENKVPRSSKIHPKSSKIHQQVYLKADLGALWHHLGPQAPPRSILGGFWGPSGKPFWSPNAFFGPSFFRWFVDGLFYGFGMLLDLILEVFGRPKHA